MILYFLLGLYFLVPFGLSIALDPAPGLLASSAVAAEQECRFVDEEHRHLLPSAQWHEAPARGAFADTRTMLCQNRVVGRGDRAHDTLLSELSHQIPPLARRVRELAPQGTRWHVDAEHFSPAVAEKIAFAAKVALVEDNATVLEANPILSAEALQRLQNLKPEALFPEACRTLAGALADDERIFTLFLMHPAGTELHAGLCAKEGWRWVL